MLTSTNLIDQLLIFPQLPLFSIILTFTLPFKLESIEKLKGQYNYTYKASLVFYILIFYNLDELTTAKAELPTKEATLKVYNKREITPIITIQLSINQN